MSKIKVIDLISYVEDNTSNKFTAYRDMTMGIIQGPKGVIVTDDEACHTIETEENFELQIALTQNDGKIALMPHSIAAVGIEQALEEATVTEMPLREYIREFGSRLEMNYGLLLDSIREVGLDPDDFEQQITVIY